MFKIAITIVFVVSSIAGFQNHNPDVNAAGCVITEHLGGGRCIIRCDGYSGSCRPSSGGFKCSAWLNSDPSVAITWSTTAPVCG